MHTRRSISPWLWLLLASGLPALIPTAASAQICDPSFQDCSNPPGVSISPSGITTDSTDIGVTITWADPDGVAATTRRLFVNGQERSMSSWTHTTTATVITSTGRLTISDFSGATIVNAVEARISDPQGGQASATATYTYQAKTTAPLPKRNAPAVSLVNHVSGFRNTALGGQTLAYSTPAYVSMDQARLVTLAYSSGQSAPAGYVAVDIRNPAEESAWRYSVRVVDPATNVAVAQHKGQAEEFYDATIRPFHGETPESPAVARIGVLWDAGSLATGDYKYKLLVRTYWRDSTWHETEVPIRMLVVNERTSPFGEGWSLVGWQRLYPGRYGDGVMVVDGDGTARFYEGSCAGGGQHCTYQGPPGDFSTLEWVPWSHYQRNYPDGSRVRFAYAGSHYVVHWSEDRFGHRTTWSYAAGKPTSITDPTGKYTTLTYNNSGYLVSIETPGGRVSRFQYSGTGLFRIIEPDGTRALDSMTVSERRLARWNDRRGKRWDARYSHHFLSRNIGPLVAGARDTTSYLSPMHAFMVFGAATTLGAPAAPKRPDAWATTTDPLKHVVKYRTDGFGNVTWSSSPSGDVTTATFDENGLPLTRSTPAGESSGFTWSSRGELLEQYEQGHLVHQAWYTRVGLPDSTRSGGQTTHYRYGNAGLMLSSWTGTRADSAAKATRMTYDSGRLISVSTPEGIRRQLQYYQDGWYNLGAVHEWRMVGAAEQWVTTYLGYNGYGLVEATEGPNGRTSTGYDQFNRPLWSVVGRYPTYDGSVSYGYTGPDLTSVTDATGKQYRWTYDALGRVTEEWHADGGVRRYAYNRDGQVMTRIDRRGMAISMAYDNEHRVSHRIAGADTTTFAYQTYPARVVVRNGVSTDTLNYHHVHAGLLSRQATILGGRHYEMSHRIDAGTGISSGFSVKASANGTLVWQDNISTALEFLPATHPTLSATYGVSNIQGRFTTFGYDKAGRHVQTTYPNGLVRQHAYDAQQRPGGTYFAGNQSLSRETGAWFRYDALGRQQSRQSIGSDSLRSYTYNPLGMLTGIAITPTSCDPLVLQCPSYGGESFSYDKAGNRTDSGAGLGASTDRYTQFNGETLEYDAEGNLVRRVAPDGRETRYYWNELGQMHSTGQVGGYWVNYAFNGLGQRVSRKEWSTNSQTYFLYHQGNLLAEIDGAGNPIRTYNYNGIDNPVSVTVGNPANGPTYYYVNEQPGHVIGLLDGARNLVNRYRYKAFGQFDAGTGGSVDQPLGYMARELDRHTGLHYVRARWYDSSLGRFISEDPIGLAGGMNTYAYAGNDPINMRDPSGLRPELSGCDRAPWLRVCQTSKDKGIGLDPWTITANCHRTILGRCDNIDWDGHMGLPEGLSVGDYFNRRYRSPYEYGMPWYLPRNHRQDNHTREVAAWNERWSACMQTAPTEPFSMGGAAKTGGIALGVGLGLDFGITGAVGGTAGSPIGTVVGGIGGFATGLLIASESSKKYQRNYCSTAGGVGPYPTRR